jgi:hypothetical protein
MKLKRLFYPQPYNLKSGDGMAKPTKQRGYPDRRGLWAESDVISEQFTPSKQYKAQQRVMAQTLIAAGLSPEQIESMLLISVDLPSDEKPKDERPKDEKPEDS